MNACCGLKCSECPSFMATLNNSDTAREKVATQWSKFFGMTLTLKDINCDGCQSDSERLFMYCKSCQVKECCQSKRFSTCAECSDYPCDKLNNFFSIMPDAKKGLEAIRNTII